jgi:hypothetical protein
MKIHHITDGISIILSNEERHFIDEHQRTISLSSLNEHDAWTAQNLVRKGVYKISNDGKTLIVKTHANRSSII